MTSLQLLVGSSVWKEQRETRLNSLSAGLAALKSDWKMRTNLDFPWTEMLDFFQETARLSSKEACKEACASKKTQTLSSVFSIRTLKMYEQPLNTMSHHEDSCSGGLFFFFFFYVLCFTFLWMAILKSLDVQPTCGVHLTSCVNTFILRLF